MNLYEEINKLNIDVSLDEPMDKHTTFRVGGLAQIFARPSNSVELSMLVKLALGTATPCYVVGKGSNLLVGDKGIKGLVIATNRMDSVSIEGTRIVCGAGASLTAVAGMARDAGLSGLEFAYGIPGSVGGAVVMNAGAYGGEIKDCLCEVTVLDGTEIIKLAASELELSYRHSNITQRNLIVLEAVFELKTADISVISEACEKNMSARKEKQPLEYPNAGSTFKRPEGYFAGKLIEDAGLRGFSVGGACVSEKHCGFIINQNNASAAQILELMNYVSDVVFEKYGVKLEPEIRLAGEF